MSQKEIPKFRAEMLDLDPENRDLTFEPVVEDEEMERAMRENRPPMLRGIALHQHCDLPVVTDEGVYVEHRCDYVVLDINQVVQLRTILEGLTIMTKEGLPTDDDN